MKSLKEKIREVKESRAQNDPHQMTEEERAQHEKYVADLTEQNRRTVRKVCTILWCVAMVGWVIFLVLDVVFAVGAVKITFHSTGAILTAFLACRRVGAFFASRKEKNEHTDA